MSETKFGLNQLSNRTPKWAKQAFYITAALTTVATFIVSSDPGIPANITSRIIVYLKGLDMLVLVLSKMFGLQQDSQSDENIKTMADGPGGTDPDKPHPQKPV
jgi:hypothetical protein